MIFGTFDYFHAGHENLIKQAKLLGDYIIAIVARDQTVKQIKGLYPDNSERKRLEVIKNHPSVDKAILGNLDNKFKVIKKFKPNIIALGYDQFVFTYRLEKFLIDKNINAKISRLKAYEPEIYKSSIIRKKNNESVIKHKKNILSPSPSS